MLLPQVPIKAFQVTLNGSSIPSFAPAKGIVVEANLTVHVAALRRTLGDGHGGNRYLLYIPRMLRDVGITRSQAERECAKPFWR